MKKLLIAALAALMLVPAAYGQSISMDEDLFIDGSGVFQRSFELDNTAKNRLGVQAALLAKVSGGFYFGFQGETTENGDPLAGGAMAFYRLPWYVQPDKSKEGLIGFELVGWGNMTDKAFNFKAGAAGIGVIYVPKKTSRTSFGLRFLIDGYENILSVFLPPDPEAVRAALAAGTPTPLPVEVQVEDTGVDFSLAFNIRLSLID